MESILILSIMVYLVHQTVGQSLRLVPGDQVQPKTVGSGLIIKCDATDLGPGEDPQLTWTSSQGTVITSVDPTDTVFVQGKGSQSLKLRITSVHGEHAGKWICTGVLGGQTQTKHVTFDVWEDISFEGEKKQRPTIYTDALINCRVSGSPQPEVTWSHNQVDLEKGRYIPKTEGLQILNISKADNGLYSCNAEITSRGRYEEYEIDVEVVIPPTLTSPPKMTSAIEGKDLTLYCRASGDPTPQYKWYKDNRGTYVELINGGRYEINEVEGTMKILKLEVTDDGTYKCVATNLGGSAEGTAEVDVLVPPKIIQIDHGDGTAMASVKMLCVATGSPAPEMKWQKVGSSSPFSSGLAGQPVPDSLNSRVTITQNKESDRTRLEMQIDRLQPSDIGNYTCSASNEAGNDAKNSPVNVFFAPEFNNNPSAVVYAWSSAKGRNVTCVVDGNPLALVTWERHGQQLVSNDTYQISNTEKIRQVESNLTVRVDFTNENYVFGEYVCKGTNKQGSGQTVITLREAELPSAPSTLEIVRESQTWIRLRIGAPGNNGGMPVTGYSIELNSPGHKPIKQDVPIANERTNDDEGRPKTPVDIQGLSHSTLYTISVKANTEVGLGQPREVQHTTKDLSVPEPVQIISRNISDSGSSYRLTWAKPRDGGSPIIRFDIGYRYVVVNKTTGQIIDVKSDYKKNSESNPEATSFQLDNLVPNRTYQIEISAINSLGVSEKRHIFMTTRSGPESGGDIDMEVESGSELKPEPENDPDDDVDKVMTDGDSLSTGTIVGLVIIIFFILLIIVDVTCYFKNRCGIIMCVRENVCGRGAGDDDRQAALEEGDAKETQPLAQKEKPEGKVKGVGAENQAGVVEDEKKQPLLDDEDKGGVDGNATEVNEEKVEVKDPEDKEVKIEEPLVETGKEVQEDPPARTPEAEVQPPSENTTNTGETA